jgi:acylphosphatase
MMSRMSFASTLSPDFRPKSEPCHRRQLHYSGRVQGVGFRYTVKNIAMRHNISGYVRNLADGRVELVVEGPDAEIDELLTAVKDRMSGYIRNVDIANLPATGEFSHFHIRH